LLKIGAAVGLGATTSPLWARETKPDLSRLATRPFGRTGFDVTTLGLGGQASLQWTPPKIDPVEIIVQAYRQGVNYFDTSNVYDDSQLNYGKAFRRLGLVPGQGNYDESRRRRVFVASKTMLRMAKGRMPLGPRVEGTQGPSSSRAIDDLKRALTQVFGDGKGAYHDDAYLDLFQIHNLMFMEEVNAIYMGLKKPDRKAFHIGALAALRDYRDGTNLTGLNPNEERRIRHIGITGHHSSPVLTECIQRDDEQLLDTLLVAINANDRLYFNSQFNVIPVAAAKGMGIIAMKVFADGAMFGRKARWNHIDRQVIQTVGSASIPSKPLVQYALSIPGVSTAIIGIGKVDKDPKRCQLQQNLAAAQLDPPLNGKALQDVEQLAASVLEGRTNYFQLPAEPLGAPRDAAIQAINEGGKAVVRLSWHTAFAADAPITHYRIERDGREIGKVLHKPQTTKTPFTFKDSPQDNNPHSYKIATVDAQGRMANTEVLEAS
jgi:aryl-alcohol dehydrogenase-like predicted oxidoreductase